MKNSILDSLDVLVFNDRDKVIGTRQHVRECIAAEYGQLPEPEKQSNSFKSSANTKSVRFGHVARKSWKVELSPALQLLSLCVQIDAIAQTPANLGMILRLNIDDVPSRKPDGAGDDFVTVADWVASRRSICERKYAERQSVGTGEPAKA